MLGEETTKISSILGELNLDDDKGNKIPDDDNNASSWLHNTSIDKLVKSFDAAEFELKKGLGKSPPVDYVGESASLNDKKVNVSMEEVDFDVCNQQRMETEEGSLPRLQKASSVPQIHSESLTSKKTSEANPLPDKKLFANVMQENQLLRENLLKLKTKNGEIIAINHDWDKSYNSLVLQHAELQKQFQKHNEQLNNEIVKKEEEKNRMKMKLERFFNEGSLDEKTMLAEEKEEKNKILKREQAAIQTAKEFQLKCQHLDHILRQTNQQKVNLEREMQRLTLCVESQQQHKNFAGLGDSQNLFNGDVNEMELLRQQLQTYVEDFNAEKSEKQRLLQENEEMKIKLVAKVDENEHLKTQLEIYEKDFSRQREKRIQQMRKANQMSRTVMPPVFASNTHHEDAQRKMQEYNSLAVEKEHIVDRMSNLENQGVTAAWSTASYNSNGNSSSNSISNSLPPYPQSPQGYTQSNQSNQSLPRSAPPYTFPTDTNSDRFFNEKVMRDRGILSRSIPEKSDSCVSNFNNLTNSTNSCWSYFGR